ncbi:hypothetical protein OG455_03015 [Kitasatospora sp. NBC_01287]|uniref:hypothetical protein n=1 Tax=Kitasatospora sp. NBC_01287 TaxID=2903573 RepID=UPI0022578B29|nr:hypothetical protein [Kitasatospora sp. NBC_01287]MCX4744499.1 hypothetical protein [Kitasatospora sp. NBC_01287]
MFVAGPGGQAPGGAPALRLDRALAREFGTHSATALDPDLRVFVADLLRPYGQLPDEAALAAGRGQSYGEMAEALVRELVPDDRPVDLLILVFGSPDVQPGRAAAVHLSRHCPGGPLAFALGDQGTAGAFSALRIAREYVRSGDCRRALVVVAEQAELHYPLTAGAPWPDRHAVVGLLCEAGDGSRGDGLGGPHGLGELLDHSAVSSERLPGLLLAELAGLADPTAVLLLGAGLAGVPTPLGFGDVVRARTGSPYTGLWSALAEGLPGWQAANRPLVLADHDATLGYLSLARWQATARRSCSCSTVHRQETARPFVQEVATC